jgi:drug/metabolite transporter (DMT)-like permease
MIGVISKIVAEGLVTLYTVVVRTSSFSPLVQSAFRSVIIPLVLLPLLFFTGSNVFQLLGTHGFSLSWIGIGIINLLHIIASFEGFKILPTGPAVTLYFTYPLMAVMLSYFILNRSISYQSIIGIVLALVGTFVMNITNERFKIQKDQDEGLTMNLRGIGWIFVSAFTEALMYLFVIAGGIEFNNSLFTTFALYAWAGILSLGYLVYTFVISKTSSNVHEHVQEPDLISYDMLYIVLANIVFGVGGKVLLYSSARGLSTGSYASLSYIGILFAYIYGIFLGDRTSFREIVGSSLVMIGSLFGGLQ